MKLFLDTDLVQNIDIPAAKIAEFCQRWKVREFALFGSVLREDFCPDSDIDILVSFAPDSKRTLLDLMDMQDELELLLGRRVNVVSK